MYEKDGRIQDIVQTLSQLDNIYQKDMKRI